MDPLPPLPRSYYAKALAIAAAAAGAQVLVPRLARWNPSPGTLAEVPALLSIVTFIVVSTFLLILPLIRNWWRQHRYGSAVIFWVLTVLLIRLRAFHTAITFASAVRDLGLSVALGVGVGLAWGGMQRSRVPPDDVAA
jgi:hypothetical protein